MSKRAIILVKTVMHVLCLLPVVWLLHLYRSGALALDPDPINFITHFTGDWALWILLVSLAITPVRRLAPQIAWLIRLRRLVGLYAFFYATLHLATYLFFFSGYDIAGVLDGLRRGHVAVVFEQWKLVWPFVWDDVLKRRFVQVGFLAWLILFALSVTSPSAIMRFMGGKNWQRLHRLVYIAGIAAVIHYWWLVKAGVRTPWKVTALLGILLVARTAHALSKRTSRFRATTTAAKQSEVL